MDQKMGDAQLIITQLPVGYRFLPTDEELVNYYLLNKIFHAQLIPPTIIQDIEANVLYSQPPSNLGTFLTQFDHGFFFYVFFFVNFMISS